MIQYQGQTMLLDAGLGPLTISRRLDQHKSNLKQIKAIVITHLDQDHFRLTWIKTMIQWEIPLYIHTKHISKLERTPQATALLTLGLVRGFTQKFSPINNLEFDPIYLHHDQQGTFGYRIDCDMGAIGFATDLGHVPDELIQKFTNVDLIALESNYDPKLQQLSPRLEMLKRRVMGQAGHLSNDQAFKAIQQIARRSSPNHPKHVVLLHRSQQCNTEEKIRQVFAQNPELASRLVLTEQVHPSRWFKIRSTRKADLSISEQMTFGF